MDRLDQIAAYVRVVELEAFQPQHAIWGRHQASSHLTFRHSSNGSGLEC
jgi:hypothetical protein